MFEAFDIPGLLSSQPLNNFAFTPFYIMHALAQYTNVLLIWDGMEILSDKLEALILEDKNPITLFGKQAIDDPKLLGFSSFFPMAQFYPKNFTIAHFKDGSRNIIEWLMKCGGTTDCYDCRNQKGYAMDCLPFLLSRLSADLPISYRSIEPKIVESQRWEPPSCDTKCIITVIISVLFSLVIVIVGILIYFQMCIQKIKK